MGRPPKQSVDYFPHFCSHKKTMFVLEERYGNDGYAFWFKLLEMLGTTEGHCINLNDPTEMEFLLAKTHFNEVSGTEILNLLAKLGAIDPEAWAHKSVWCQNFVDGLASVYQKRQQPLPQRPSCFAQKPDGNLVSGDGNHTSNWVISPETPQSRVEESRVEESREYSSPIPEESNEQVSISKDAQAARRIYDHWNSQGIIQHKKLTDKMRRRIKSALETGNTEDEIKQAISNYAEILHGDQYYFKYTWPLDDFLQRGLSKFGMPVEIVRANYTKDKGNGTNSKTGRRVPTTYDEPPEYDD